MRRALSLALMLAAAPASAQLTERFPGATDAGVPVALPNGRRAVVQAVTQVDASGNPIAVAASGDQTGTGTLALATANATYAIALTNGRNTVGLTINGLTGSGATLTAERSNDGGTTWTNANTTESSTTSSLSATLTANGQARIGVAGATNIRLRVSTVGTGTATIAYNATTAAGAVFLTSALPSYSTPDGRVIGGVDNRFINGAAISTGAGVTDAGTQRMALASDGTYATAANQNSTVAGTSATNAQGVQGVTGGVPVNVNAMGLANLSAPSSSSSGTTVRNWLTPFGAQVLAVYDGGSTTTMRGDANGTAVIMGLDSTALGGAAATTVLGSAANQYKATTGNVASLNLVNSTVAGFVAVLDVAAAPTAGAAITAAQLKYCMPVAASVGFDKVFQVPLNLTNGVHVAMLTSCTAYTTIGTAPVSLTVQFK